MARTRLTSPQPLVSLLYNPYQVSFLNARRLRVCPGLCVAPDGTRLQWSMLESLVCPGCQKTGIRPFRRFYLRAGRRGGKALDINTPIPTPHGWRTMANLEVGDPVFDDQGQPTRVTFVTPVYLPTECYRVVFNDGNVLIADGDHQWVTTQKNSRKRPHRFGPTVVTTKTIARTLLTANGESNHAVLAARPLQYPPAALPIQPYTLGAWLGDGSSASADLCCSEPEIVWFIEADGYAITQRKTQDRSAMYGIGGTGGRRDPLTGRMVATSSIHSTLKAIGLMHNKHIPEAYFAASVDQRLALLQGLMDTDGQVNADGSCEFDSTNVRLAEGVLRLTRGLGIISRFYQGTAKLYGREIGPKWRVTFRTKLPAARLARKLARIQAGAAVKRTQSGVYRFIVAVEPVTPVLVKCIQVAAASEMYLAGDGCIPTHNSRIGALSAIEESTVPYSMGWCCAPSFPELEDYVIPAFFSQLPQEWFDHPLTEWSEDRLTLVLPNRAQVAFRSLDDPNRGAGPGLDWVWIDEGRKIQKLAWLLLRPALTERKGIAWVTSSPDWGEDWCHTEFFQPAIDGRPGYWATEYKTVDNPIIDPAEVESARLSMPPELFRREYEASLEYPTGTIYGTLIDKCEADDDRIRQWLPEWPRIDPTRPSIAAMDPGTDHPFAAVLIVVTPFGLVVVKEYEERNRVYVEHAAALKVLVAPMTPRWAIDKTQAQAAIEMAAHGIYAQGAEYDVDGGIQRVYSWMALGQLRIARSTCPLLIKRLRHYRWAEIAETKKGLGKPAPFKKDDDLCFVAGTRVMTCFGDRPIETIRVGDSVLTRVGWRTVLASNTTGTKPVMRLTTSDGRTLIGTANHPIWIAGRGFIRLDELRYDDILHTCRIPIAWSRSGEGFGSIVTRTPKHGVIASIGNHIRRIAAKGSRRFIRRFGSPSTVQFLTVTTSITETAIHSTTDSTTSKRSPRAVISATIKKVASRLWLSGNIWPRFGPWRLSGTDPLSADGGTVNMDAPHGTDVPLNNSSAISARSNSNQRNDTASDSVRTPARPRGDARSSVILKFASASSAVRRLLSPSTRVRALVPDSVVRVSDVSPAGIAPVYNLTIVSKTPEYFANGILVHNCDALRYCVMLWPELPRDGPALDDPSKRNLALLTLQARLEIERNQSRDPDPSEEGLVRVTDDFTESWHGDLQPIVDSAYSEFYR